MKAKIRTFFNGTDLNSLQSLPAIFSLWLNGQDIRTFIIENNLGHIFTPKQFQDIIDGKAYMSDDLCMYVKCKLPFLVNKATMLRANAKQTEEQYCICPNMDKVRYQSGLMYHKRLYARKHSKLIRRQRRLKQIADAAAVVTEKYANDNSGQDKLPTDPVAYNKAYYYKNVDKYKLYHMEYGYVSKVCPVFQFLLEIRQTNKDLYCRHFKINEGLLTYIFANCPTISKSDANLCALTHKEISDEEMPHICPVKNAFKFKDACLRIRQLSLDIRVNNK